MKVREIMSTDITKATPENTLVDIAAIMRDEDIGALPVVQEEELKGIVTDRDIVIRAVAEGKDPSTTIVQEILSEQPESIEPDADVEEAADLMASRQFRRLPVVEDGKLLGMVSIGDIAVKHEKGVAARALKGVSEGVKTSRATQAAAAESNMGNFAVSQKSSAAAPKSTPSAKGKTSRNRAA